MFQYVQRVDRIGRPMVYEGDWKAKNLKQLENKIRTCLSKMNPKVVQDHAKTVRSRFDIIHRHGVQNLN
ncbi:hypothetical protein BpHYR1_003530 [Brachionus plicatilis]|uniref:Uncharacterized protein n=1 Tax=Brachionus plicatilis TaxID=10195 RepID=A0A3M7RVK4_BRAPC|nr:hypothetical protein BpHYR1_003530 [Brachionus plicatilis]